MQSFRKLTPKDPLSEAGKATNGHPRADAGLVLVDTSLKVIAADSGAVAILSHSGQRGLRIGALAPLPEEILAAIRDRDPADFPCLRTFLVIGGREYVFRAYMIDAHPDHQQLLALHFEQAGLPGDLLAAVCAEYHLTQREQEALSGILVGLSTRDLARQMEISPNTVKTFLRLIMIKMGVSTRAGILARILHERTAPDSRSADAASGDSGGKKHQYPARRNAAAAGYGR